MSDLPLPEQFKGPWEHLLILTYGMDLPFFEQALLREVSSRCRNRIILGDGQHFLDACALYQQNGLARYFNQRYVAEGIFAPRAAHVKLILLTNATAGRLLIGSGNLSMQGYASGGELFTSYAYSATESEQRDAFSRVRDLLDGLLVRRYLSESAERYLQVLFTETPWLIPSQPGTSGPVRHNLNQSLLQQLRVEVGDDPVEELAVLSPFYDEECVALAQLLKLLRPARVSVLIQPKQASVDPAALQKVLGAYGGEAQIRPVQRADGNPYLHAKLYLVKQAARAICLQGSANLSQAALTLIDPQGNIELANLMSGPRDAFDHLLAGLAIADPVDQVQSLEVSYQKPEPSTREAAAWTLTAAAWDGARLRIEDRNTRPDLAGASYILGNHAYSAQRTQAEPQAITCTLPPEAAATFERPVALRIQLADGTESNPVFVCNTATLDAALEVTADDATLNRIGGLDLDDHELESLLSLLDNTLVYDQRSIWHAAGKPAPPSTTPDGEDIHLSYADIDYAMLRHHPRIQQYLRGIRGGGGRAGRTRLQVILSAIASHFLDLLDRATQATPAATAAALVATTELTEEELEEEDPAPVTRSWGQAQRTQRILKAFIQRYLRGVEHPEFRALVGVEVLALNQIIFSHILWRIWLKEWVDADVLIAAFVRTWRSFWGSANTPGCLSEASAEVRGQIEAQLREHYTVSTLLAALVDAATWAQTQNWIEEHLMLRDFWRAFLNQHRGLVTQETIEEIWLHLADAYPYDTPSPADIVEHLTALANFETRQGFLRDFEQRYCFPRGSCHIERAEVNRESQGRTSMVDCLVIEAAEALQTPDDAMRLISDWMSVERRDYYRVVSPALQRTERVALYEVEQKAGIHWDRLARRQTDLGPITVTPAPWVAPLAHLRQLASQIQVTITLPERHRAPALRPERLDG